MAEGKAVDCQARAGKRAFQALMQTCLHTSALSISTHARTHICQLERCVWVCVGLSGVDTCWQIMLADHAAGVVKQQ